MQGVNTGIFIAVNINLQCHQFPFPPEKVSFISWKLCQQLYSHPDARCVVITCANNEAYSFQKIISSNFVHTLSKIKQVLHKISMEFSRIQKHMYLRKWHISISGLQKRERKHLCKTGKRKIIRKVFIFSNWSVSMQRRRRHNQQEENLKDNLIIKVFARI